MKVLFQCNTVYQLFVAMTIKENYFFNDECSIIISDIMNDSENLKERIKQLNLFKNVYLQKINKIKYTKLDKIFISRKKSILFYGFEDVLSENIDVLLFSNATPSNILLYKELLKNNINIELDFFEDGLSTYSNNARECYYDNATNFRRFFFNNKLLLQSKKIYVFNNKFFMWKPQQELCIIPPIKSNDNIVSQLNLIFNYNEDILPTDCKCIYFEEGFYGDNIPVNDVEIIEKCISKFGKDGFYIKTHPRNKINRFSKMNIKTLLTNSIPWELIVINNMSKINNIKLITISSAAMYTTNYMFDCKPKCYSCVKLVNDRNYLFKYIPEVEEIISQEMENFIVLNQKDFD